MANLSAYKQQIRLIKQYALEHNISESQTTEIFNKCFQMLEIKYSKKTWSILKLLKYITTFICVLLIIFIGLYNHPFYNTMVLRNLQSSIYPGLKILRKIALPIIEKYPMLSELYDEWCLVENQFFYVSDMDCWPCSIMSSVPDLTNHNITKTFNIGIPYTKAENNVAVNMQDLFEMYWYNNNTFKEDSNKIFSNNDAYRTIHDVMDKRLDIYPSESLTTHITWRINRMKPGRIIRKLFPKPMETPNWWGQSIEKFIFIDEANSPLYSLPRPECSNVILRFTDGARLIKMMPSLECQQNCKTSTILLSNGYTCMFLFYIYGLFLIEGNLLIFIILLVWYNWWYWRPMSLPVSNSTTISISYLTSFC
ncbi:uncharacterized protein LOC124951045 isoform X1 [Vespa velutina]|uniref:uncharacterized protein LOC124951045 isoform X1 n=1 Tax=Vespa velutina TaxID=202808 RepID=UPI001FB5272B|nr:uncharacterized protein LOC124951045 isoform X1 [Vespa velutina]